MKVKLIAVEVFFAPLPCLHTLKYNRDTCRVNVFIGENFNLESDVYMTVYLEQIYGKSMPNDLSHTPTFLS